MGLQVTRLLDEVELIVVPFANPDGCASTRAFDLDRLGGACARRLPERVPSARARARACHTAHVVRNHEQQITPRAGHADGQCLCVRSAFGGSASGSASVVTLISKRRRDPLDLIRYLYTWSNTRLWRKNRSPAPTGSTCIGTDLNRNFNDHWGQGGSSTSPCSDTYMGISAGSEPEVQAISDYFRLNLPIYGAIDWYGKFQSSGSFSRRVLRVFCVCLPL